MYKLDPNPRNRSWILASWLVGALAACLVAASGSVARAQTDDIPAKIAAAKDSYDGADHVVVFENTDVTVADNGIGTNTHTRVVKILSDTGIPGQSVRRWSFDPATKTARLEGAHARRDFVEAPGGASGGPARDSEQDQDQKQPDAESNHAKTIVLFP